MLRVFCLLFVCCAVGCAHTAQSRAQGWYVARTEAIELHTDAGENEAGELATKLQAIYDLFRADVFPCTRLAGIRRINITALTNESDMEAIGRIGVAGFFRAAEVSWLDPMIVLHARREQSTAEIFAHELTHRLVAICYPRAPIWLDEGLATTFETVRLRGADQYERGLAAFGFGDLLDVKRTDEGGWVTIVSSFNLPSVHALRAMSRDDFYVRGDDTAVGQATRIARYAAAWALVHMLQFDTGDLNRRWTAYLGALATESAAEPALWDRCFGDVDLEAARAEYIRVYRDEHHLPYQVAQRRSTTSHAEPQVEPMIESDAHIHWARLWGWDTPDARAHALEHLDLALAPNEMGVRGQAYLLRGLVERPDGTAELSERAIADALAASYDPMVSHAALVAELVRRPPDVGRVAHAAERLVQVAERPEDFALLAAAELVLQRPREALQLTKQAITQDPFCWRCYLIHGDVFAHVREFDQAQRAYDLALALLPEGADDAAISHRILALLRSRTETAVERDPTGDH